MIGLRLVKYGLAVLLGSTAHAQVTQRVSVSSDGAEGNDTSGWYFPPSLSADGRHVVFASYADNLVSGDSNREMDVFVRDRHLGITERLSVASDGAEGDDYSLDPRISADGRYVLFTSLATNLVPGDTNGHADAFVRDRLRGTTELVSVGGHGSISADGRFIVGTSGADDLVPGDTNDALDVFLHDRKTGTTERVSLDSRTLEANGDSYAPSISSNARFVAFASYAPNLVPGDANGCTDVFVRDRRTGTTERVSVDSGGVEGNWISDSPSISADGRYVAFVSISTNLDPWAGGRHHVFVRDREARTTELVSVASAGTPGNLDSSSCWISGDGRFVAFASIADNLVPGDTNGFVDIFLRDLRSGTTERVSVDSAGAQGGRPSILPFLSADGRYVAFESWAGNLVPKDSNAERDIFVRDRLGGPSFRSLCDAGADGVIGCPCANPPGGTGRGCDNSSATGGAVLEASGGTYLSSDNLVFTTSGEKPTALSVVTQWTATSSTGALFGMGVRCTSGTLERLYTKSAVGGSIAAPNLLAGDPQVSVRSAALGDTILAGQSRWYVVYYRDPNVLGGCPALSTFNATQTGEVAWSP